jgi:hypothetical protein
VFAARTPRLSWNISRRRADTGVILGHFPPPCGHRVYLGTFGISPVVARFLCENISLVNIRQIFVKNNKKILQLLSGEIV